MIIDFLEKYKKYLNGKLFSTEDINNINFYINKSWYLQLLKQYGINILLIILEMYKSLEDYTKCYYIIKTIHDSNTNFGTTYVDNIEKL